VEEVQKRFGNHLQLILDANQSYDAAETRKWDRLISGWDNILWLEEPLPLNRLDDYRLLRSTLSVPLAGGENIGSPEGFLPLLKRGALDIVMPDILHQGGADEFRDSLVLARRFGLRVSPHTFDGALSRLYTLFAQACLTPWSKMTGEAAEPVEWDAMENPMTAVIPLQPIQGRVKLPGGPGIGLELDEELLQAYRWDGGAYK
jgi:D-galactarolactone cycloisomerase